MEQFLKNPNAKLDYTIDWSRYLGPDTISAAEWTVPVGLTKVSDSKTDTTTTVWLSSGIAGVDYQVMCKITTIGGRIDERTILILVRER